MINQSFWSRAAKQFSRWRKQLAVVDLILLFLATAFVFYLIFRFDRQPQVVWLDLTFARQSSDSNPPEYWQVADINPGDKIYNSLGNEVAVVREVQQIPWRGGARLYTYLTIEMEALYQQARKIYTAGDTPLIVGENLPLVINNTAYTGVINKVYQPGDQDQSGYQQARVTLFCREYETWHAQAAAELEIVDNQGETVVETVASRIYPASVAVETSDGRLVNALHPYKKDFELDLLLHDVSCVDDRYCFYNKTQTFMVGTELWLDSGTTFLGENCSVKSFELVE